jgi:hypothetical protein
MAHPVNHVQVSNAIREEEMYPTCARTYATLRVYPTQTDPDDITKLLNIFPSRTQRTGDLAHPGSTRTVPLAGWFLTSKETIDSVDVQDHLHWLLSLILPRRSEILELQADCRMDVSCNWLSEQGHGGPTLTPKIMGELAQLNLELWFDVY